MYLNGVQENPIYLQAPLREYDYIHIMTTNILYTILNDELYYCIALVWTAIMAFAVGMLIGVIWILCL